MLKGIDPILTPDLLRHLCAMGHGEWVAIVDANFTAEGLAAGRIPLVRLPGLDLARVSRAVLSVFPLDRAVPQPAGYMQHGELPPGQTTAAQEAFITAVSQLDGVPRSGVEPIERFEFYRRTERARLIVQTGEATAYGNGLLAKGVILP
jgi:L-fucose mutarotase